METDVRTHRFFIWMDRAFWLIWLSFPVLICVLVSEILSAPARLAELAPSQSVCLSALPQLANFSALGLTVFWMSFGIEFLVYAVILALAHLVIHRCAQGQVLVAEMIRVLYRVGLIIALWPVAELLLTNLLGLVLSATGDVPVFTPGFALDVPVLGVGLVIITISVAMRQAVRLREDADLTI